MHLFRVSLLPATETCLVHETMGRWAVRACVYVCSCACGDFNRLIDNNNIEWQRSVTANTNARHWRWEWTQFLNVFFFFVSCSIETGKKIVTFPLFSGNLWCNWSNHNDYVFFVRWKKNETLLELIRVNGSISYVRVDVFSRVWPIFSLWRTIIVNADVFSVIWLMIWIEWPALNSTTRLFASFTLNYVNAMHFFLFGNGLFVLFKMNIFLF